MSFPKRLAADDRIDCPLVVVQDHPQECPYLDDQIARMPLELPVGPVSGLMTDGLLEKGYRRSGNFVYRTRCARCNECRPTRLNPKTIRWGRSFKRVLNRGDRELNWHWGPPETDATHVALFNRHRDGRRLGRGEYGVSLDSYEAFLTESFCQTMQLSMFRQDRLVGVSIVDVGQRSLSAVYTFFDPAESRLSLGTFAILRQINWALEHDLDWVYLGMYVAENRHLNYKARFGPQERLIDGTWQAIDDSTSKASR